MILTRGMLFHNRYLLVSALGDGASADVWKAKDTKANNLMVALKIFSQHSEMDTYGLQNFEREFTTVYNMKHSNLLPPTGYDICEGCPYLVMQYCENGSCSSMIGRMEEEDIIKFLHDVSAGLEYLHDHNIIHQDIKPDNILLDDNCNFMVTDFGISVNAEGEVDDAGGMSGGTRGYMGPERFEGITNNASDIWSLGATVVELLIGYPPYGHEHGGLLQTQGEPLPELPALQPEVKNMILRCLDENPSKRIKANEIRQKIELYWETGSWTIHSPRKTIIVVSTVVASILMCLGIFVWDYNRTKVHYYKDYAEYYGVPEGIGRLSSNEVEHRDQSYKLEFSQGKLKHLSLVNSVGKVIGHTDTEHMNSRYSDVYYSYTDNGKIDYKIIKDQYGRTLFKMDYDENLKTVTFRQNDEHGTEMNLDANTNDLYKNALTTVFTEKSRISRYLLEYDDKGLLTERRYVGYLNIDAYDKDRIHGQQYKYDEKGRKIEEVFIGVDGKVMSNSNGLAIKKYTYDEEGNWTSVKYLSADGNASHDGNNCPLVRLDYDEYGNRIKESYYTLDGQPSIRSDVNVAGYSYEYDEKGNRIRQSCFGVDGSSAYCSYGFVTQRDSYNENGFCTHQEFLDENDLPTLCVNGTMSYSSMKMIPDENGLCLEAGYYDENGELMDNGGGYSRIVNKYDRWGNIIEELFYDGEEQLALVNGYYSGFQYEYDKFHRNTRTCYIDRQKKITVGDGIIAGYDLKYDPRGALIKVTSFDENGKPVCGKDLIAGYEIVYDELGNQKQTKYFDEKGKPCMSNAGYARAEYMYHPENNFMLAAKYYDVSGKIVSEDYWEYDERGNVVKFYSLTDRKLKKGTCVKRQEFDVNNRQITEWYTDLKGNKVNAPDHSYSQVKYEYDERGNCRVATFWTVNGKPAVDEEKTHRREREYNIMNKYVVEKNFGLDGKPLTGADVNPEGRMKYDQWGNLIEISCYDGYGNPRLTNEGYFIKKMKYDKLRNKVQEELLGLDGELVMSKTNGYAKLDCTYDKHGNLLETKFYNASKCFKIETQKYNEKNQLIEISWYDGERKLFNGFYDVVARITTEYDESDVVPVKMNYFDKTGTLIGTQRWNSKENKWNDLQPTGNGGGSRNISSNSNWLEAVKNDAKQLPQKLEDGVYAQSITCNNSSVTITLKLTEVSKYNLGDYDESDMKKVIEKMKTEFRKIWALPNHVSLKVCVIDKADRTMFVL